MFISLNPDDNFYFAPDEPAPAAPAAVAAPELTSTPETTSADSTQTSTSQATGATTTPAAASTSASAQASWLDSFRSEGFSAPDEATARTQLLQSHRDAERLRPLAPALSAYQQHAQQFHAWLAEQQKRQPAAQQQDWTAQLGWNHPAYDPAWRHQIVVDEKGNMTPAPGAPADIVLKYQAAQSFRQEQIEKFMTNPYKFMEPAIRHLATQAAQQYAQQNVGQYKEQQEAQQFIDKNSDWLFEQDSGRTKTVREFNPRTGAYETQKVLSNYGRQFVQALQVGAQSGLSPEMQQQYAMQSVQNSYMASPEFVQWAASQAAATAAAGSPRQQANAQFTQRANPAAPPAPVGGNAVPAPRTVTRENLEQVMLQRLQEAGVSTM